MSIWIQGSSLFIGNSSFFQNLGLKSTREKQQRQAERDNQIAFFEKQKENLKNREGETPEEISRKLDLIHSYEDQIAAVRQEYNHAQMFHLLDEAKELGEKIAEAVEKYAPKTPEEIREELVEEALGTDENKGQLTECLEEVAELTEEMVEELTSEELSAGELLTEVSSAENVLPEELSEQPSAELLEETPDSGLESKFVFKFVLPDAEKAGELKGVYRKLDIRV